MKRKPSLHSNPEKNPVHLFPPDGESRLGPPPSRSCSKSAGRPGEERPSANGEASLADDDPNLLDQQILVEGSAESLNGDFDSEGADSRLKILPLLDKEHDSHAKPNGARKTSQFRGVTFAKKTTSKKQFGEEQACLQATEETRNYVRQIRRSQVLDQRETALKSRQNSFEEAPHERPDRLRGNKILANNKDIFQKQMHSANGIGEKMIRRRHRGTHGLGFVETEESTGKAPVANGMHLENGALLGKVSAVEDLLEKKGPRMNGGSEKLNLRRQMNMFEMKNSFEGERVLGKRPWMKDFAEKIHFCGIHSYKKIEFICSFGGCLRELCSMCILEHKEHIHAIKHVNTHISEQFEKVRALDLKKTKEEINRGEDIHSRRLDCFFDEIKEMLSLKFNALRDELVQANNRTRQKLQNIEQFREEYRVLESNPAVLEFNSFTSKANTGLVKSCIAYDHQAGDFGISIERNTLRSQLQRILDDNLTMVSHQTDFNSVDVDVPKFLHWFEWGERNLHLYDIVRHSSRSVRLVNNIKIPNFSRSIVTPQAKIFLLGGEDPEGHPKKEIYMFDLLKLDAEHLLEEKAPMPHQKYDFTLCFLKGFIYVICGKDTTSEAVNICER